MPKGRKREAQRISATPVDVAKAFKAASLSLGIDPNPGFVAVLMAQSGLETGHWKIMYNFNFGNVKASDQWIKDGGDYTYYNYAAPHAKAPVSENLTPRQVSIALGSAKPRVDDPKFPDMEVGPTRNDGRVTCWFWPDHIQTRFRAFETLEEGAVAYLSKLTGRYSDALDAALDNRVSAYVELLHSKGYFTAGLEGYRRAVCKLFNRYLPCAEGVFDMSEESEMPDTGAFRTSEEDLCIHDAGFVELSNGAKITKLPIWDKRYNLAARMGFAPIADWLKDKGMRLPTQQEMEELHKLSLFVPPYTMPTSDQLKEDNVPNTESAINSYRSKHMMSQQWCYIHDTAVWSKLSDADWSDQPVANFGKHWVLPSGTIFGWWKKAAPSTDKIQNPSQFHKGDPTYCDYATNSYAVLDAVVTDDDVLETQDLPTLKKGDAGHWVGVWQQRLVNFGFSLAPYGVDQDFGSLTEAQTQEFQALMELPETGVVDDTVWEASEAEVIKLPEVVIKGWVPEKDSGGQAQHLKAPTGADRQRIFGPLTHIAAPTKGNPEGIRITNDWVSDHLVQVEVPQIAKIPGVVVYKNQVAGRGPSNGKVWFHRMGAEQLKALWQEWEDAGLLHYVLTWAGTWNPRFIRGSRTVLSNHAFATAFDINAPWNGLGAVPAKHDKRGTVRPLVAIAEKHGFAWGGYYSKRPDGMHFELARV